MNMEKNLSNLDRGIRVILAVVFAGIALKTSMPISLLFWLSSFGIAINAATGVCGIYKIFGISTCKIK
jgi:hypothetical protein